MTKRKPISISLHEEDIVMLDKVAAEVGLTKSELIRRMLKKISCDEKMKDIIKRGYVVTSNNVHYENQQKIADVIEKKENPGDQSGADSSSLEPTKTILQNNYTQIERDYYTEEEAKYLKHLEEVAKTNWLEE